MNFTWLDYDPRTMEFLETWLDENAVRTTGLDEGFHAFYTYWAKEDEFSVGENFWCKVVYEQDTPFAAIACCRYENNTNIMEFLVKPDKRGQGMGAKVLREFLSQEEILGFPIQRSEAIIFPGNIASQKAFQNAGFQYHHTYEDGSAMSFVYESSPD